MKKIAAAFSTFIVSVAAFAATPSDASIEALFTASRAESMMDSVYGSIEPIIRQGIRASTQGKTVTPEQQRVADAIVGRTMLVMRDELNWAHLRPLLMQVYREAFDQEEIEGLTAFYKSPAGQAFVNKMPVVMQKTMALTQAQMHTLMPKLRAAVDAAVAEAKGPK